MRKWFVIDWDRIQENRPPVDPTDPESTRRLNLGLPLRDGGSIPDADVVRRAPPFVVWVDDGTIATGPDGYPPRGLIMARGQRGFKVTFEGPSTVKDDSGRQVCFTDGRVKLDDGAWID